MNKKEFVELAEQINEAAKALKQKKIELSNKGFIEKATIATKLFDKFFKWMKLGFLLIEKNGSINEKQLKIWVSGGLTRIRYLLLALDIVFGEIHNYYELKEFNIDKNLITNPIQTNEELIKYSEVMSNLIGCEDSKEENLKKLISRSKNLEEDSEQLKNFELDLSERCLTARLYLLKLSD